MEKETEGVSPKDRERIYEEEKIRHQAKEKLKQQDFAKGCLGCLGIIAAIIIVSAIMGLFTSEESVDQVGRLALRRITADKINWENMYTDRFEQLIQTEGDLWLHPALGG